MHEETCTSQDYTLQSSEAFVGISPTPCSEKVSDFHNVSAKLYCSGIWQYKSNAHHSLKKDGCRLTSTNSPSYTAYIVQQQKYMKILSTVGKMQPERSAYLLLTLYDQCEMMSTPQELLCAIIEAVGQLAVLSNDLELLKEFFVKLYTPRFATHFSDASLLLVAKQIKVIDQFSRAE